MSTLMTADEVIEALDLSPLAGEGGYFRQTWIRRAEGTGRPEATAILYLVTPDSFSALHRLDHDEMFHVYIGDPCRQVLVSPEGEVFEILLGHDLTAGMRVQHVVPGGYWQATRLLEGGRFALLGTTNSPGFVPEGFELATSATLREMPEETRERVRDMIAEPNRGGITRRRG